MKVALLAGASSIHTIRWANGLHEAGVEVHLITQDSELEPVKDGIQVYRFPNKGVLGYFSMVPGVRKLLKRLQPDIVNAHYASGYGSTARLVGYHPWMLSVWGSDVYEVPYKTCWHRWWIRKNLEAADQVASTSYCMAEQTRRIAPSLRSIAVTPFGVDIERFSSAVAKKRNWELGTSIVIGTVKALTAKYGVDTLIRAYANLRHEISYSDPDLLGRLQLRVVGDGPERKYLESLAAELGVANTVSFVGRVPHSEVPEQLRELDIYVALSRSESFGVAVIEASAAGLPVVVSDAGGLPEVVEDGKTGFVVPADDSAAAVRALWKLVEDQELRSYMGERGLAHVSASYAWSFSVQTMVSVLTELAAEN